MHAALYRADISRSAREFAISLVGQTVIDARKRAWDEGYKLQENSGAGPAIIVRIESGVVAEVLNLIF